MSDSDDSDIEDPPLISVPENTIDPLISVPESGILFGEEAMEFRDFFEFQNFKYLYDHTYSVGDTSTNGFVKELTYMRNGYIAHTLLKSSTFIDSDNLFYEGVVGQYTNKMSLIYPCFVETYGIYQYTSDKNPETYTYKEGERVGLLVGEDKWTVGVIDKFETRGVHRVLRVFFGNKEINSKGNIVWKSKYSSIVDENEIQNRVVPLLGADTYNYLKKQKSNHIEMFKNKFKIVELDKSGLISSCVDPTQICINIQYIKDSKTLYYHIGKNMRSNPIPFFCYELINILYQVYMPLAMMSRNFTHYDLHSKNVLLYYIGDDKYIYYYYHLPDGTTTSFKSQYLVKLIDYGRSFFDDPSNPSVFGNSARLYNLICETCRECGSSEGYQWFRTTRNTQYIHSQKSNASHDLRLLNDLREDASDKLIPTNSEISLFLNKVVYYNIYDSKYGTNEKKDAFDESSYYDSFFGVSKINTVRDAFRELNRIIKLPNYTSGTKINHKNELYEGKFNWGELHIYTDRPIEYINRSNLTESIGGFHKSRKMRNRYNRVKKRKQTRNRLKRLKY